ncbi:hypothetical protein [Kribbella antiqua]|nr:hypothetical protein [Kribbella antiqua]
MGSPLARVNVRADAWDLIWSFAHRVLVVNLGLAAATSPLLLALAVVSDPLGYPVFFGVLAAVVIGPAVAAGFAYLDDQGSFFRSYKRLAPRALLLSTLTLAAVGVLAADIAVLHNSMPGAALVPLLAVLGILALSIGLTMLANPDTPLRTAIYATVRRPHLTLLSLAVLAAAVVIVNQVPLAGLATVPGCALWVVQINGRIQLAGSTA